MKHKKSIDDMPSCCVCNSYFDVKWNPISPYFLDKLESYLRKKCTHFMRDIEKKNKRYVPPEILDTLLREKNSVENLASMFNGKYIKQLTFIWLCPSCMKTINEHKREIPKNFTQKP